MSISPIGIIAETSIRFIGRTSEAQILGTDHNGMLWVAESLSQGRSPNLKKCIFRRFQSGTICGMIKSPRPAVGTAGRDLPPSAQAGLTMTDSTNTMNPRGFPPWRDFHTRKEALCATP